MRAMNSRTVLVSLVAMWLAGCGGAAPAPAGPSPASSKPAASAPAPAAAASSVKPAAAASGAVALKGSYITTSPTSAPLWVGREMGIFAKNGLDVSLTSVTATAAMPALMANDTQLASSGAAEVAAADLQGGSVVMIAEGAALPIFSLYANKKYKTIQDLSGKTIGVTSIGAASDTAAHLFLRKFNLEGKVKTVAAGGSSGTILAAMTQSIIPGGILIPPVTAQAAAAGFVELVNGVKLGVPLSQGSLSVSRGFLKNRPDVANRLLKSYLASWMYLSNPANKAAVLKVFEQYTKTDATKSEAAYNFMLPLWQSQKVPYLSSQAIGNVLGFLADPKAKSADPKQFYDNSYLEAIAKAQGLPGASAGAA